MRNTDIGQKIAIGVLIVLLLAFTGGFIYYHFRGKAPEKGRETQESISSSETSSTSDTSASLVSRQSWTAELVAAWLKDEMEPDIGEVVVYTAQTDPDQLMGRQINIEARCALRICDWFSQKICQSVWAAKLKYLIHRRLPKNTKSR